MSVDQAMVIFQPSGRRGSVALGISLIEASRLLGADVETLCGEKSVCGKCIVRIEQGRFEKFGVTSSLTHVSPWQQDLEAKFINASQKTDGYRLACVAKVTGDVLVFVPESSRASKQVVSKKPRNLAIRHNPAVKCYELKLSPPTAEEPLGDFERVCRALKTQHGIEQVTIDIFCLRNLPQMLRQGRWTVTVSIWKGREIIRVRPGQAAGSYGIAVDVGTTTVAGYLCDLKTMAVIETDSLMNPQCKYGEDVISRITYAMTAEEGLERMRSDIVQGINAMIDRVIQKTWPIGKPSTEKHSDADSFDKKVDKTGCLRLCREDIEDMTLCCNTVMHHILLGVDPQFLGFTPFPPAIQRSMNIRARDLDLRINPSAYVFVLPNVAGFVGADTVGVLIAEKPYKKDKVQLLMDIGTNGELVLGNKDKLIATSCATGPALEGAQITFGMRATRGAIERIAIDPVSLEVDYKVIGRCTWRSFSPPAAMQAKGICGSGILDVLAEFFRCGIITRSGVFKKKRLRGHPRFRKDDHWHQQVFVLAPSDETSVGQDIVITQSDIRQMQLAKGALYTGCKLMLKRMGMEKFEAVKIAGAFGAHIDREKALIMGLIPDCDPKRIQGIGNAAGDGCRAALLNMDKRIEADWICRHVEYVELSAESGFQEEFVAAMHLPHKTDAFPHLKELVAEHILNQGLK